MVRICFVCFCILLSDYISAGDKVYTVPERLFKATGADVHVSQGDLLYKSQAAGYYSGGGGMVVRSPIKTTRFVNAHLPNIQAGCGGIDIYTGGFSFISGKQIVETMKAVASNATGYAFMLGLETVSPQIANTMRQMQSWANTMNALGINSCETAAGLIGSIWPANQMASQHICQSIGTTNQIFKDHIEARHKCGGTIQDNRTRDSVKQFLPLSGEYNLTWKVLHLHPLFQGNQNKDLAEMYMTLLGTVVVAEKEGAPRHYPSKAENSDFLQRIIEGGEIVKYVCKDSEQCLTVLEKDEILTSENCWFARIRKTLVSMQNKAIHDEPLNDEEKGLLATTRLPLYKFVNVITAYRKGKPCPFDFQSIADIVAWDVLAQVIAEAIETAMQGCMQLRLSSAYSTETDAYMKSLERVRSLVQGYESRTQKALDLEMRLIEKMQILEKQINSQILID